MVNAELKTRPTGASVAAYIDNIEEERRADAEAVLQLMQRVTGEEPVMWGDGIVGFGTYHYRYATGREGDWFQVGFAARKANFALYIMAGFDAYDDLLAKLGKFKIGKSCLYVKRLSDVDGDVLEQLVRASVDYIRGLPD